MPHSNFPVIIHTVNVDAIKQLLHKNLFLKTSYTCKKIKIGLRWKDSQGRKLNKNMDKVIVK